MRIFQEQQLQEFPYLLDKILANKKLERNMKRQRRLSKFNPTWHNILEYHSDVDIIEWVRCLSRSPIDNAIQPSKAYNMAYTISVKDKPAILDPDTLKHIQSLAPNNIHIIRLATHQDFYYYQELIEQNTHEITDLRRWRNYLCCTTRTRTRTTPRRA